MIDGMLKQGVVPERLPPEQYARNFGDLHPPLDRHQTILEAERCYFCYDAPCQQACPTEIDVPLFIREISTGNMVGAARTILNQNILGGMCARVCPVETLCEQACVREIAEGKPVKIGYLQRVATDVAIKNNIQFFERSEATGKKIAIVGAGPAGIACAHRLAVLGHQVTILDGRDKAGGLNEYGIASYKTVDGFAQAEIEYVMAIGAISIELGQMLGRDFSLDDLMEKYDAVFLGIGLGGVNALMAAGQEANGVVDAIDFISEIRQADDLSKIAIGRNVIVIGGGMTAIDAAIQAKLLGAEQVTICYRRGAEQMNASKYEQDLAVSKGVVMRHWLRPHQVLTQEDRVVGLELEYTHMVDGKLKGMGHKARLPADQIFMAIGQALEPETADGLIIVGGRIGVDEQLRTSRDKVWAGGDCIINGDDLTVTAVAHGRDAAISINKALMGEDK
ncbi:NAD-dependent dihydropyrimidine dehydrogenase subunit PreT [hydrothermal vent metagenome]|uniref:Dihydrothymine dehydrogenase n=1 Tax=hydrothermal vent metagenome TaxID=652676 RepID=A0A3B0U0Q8_9ZZZZ